MSDDIQLQLTQCDFSDLNLVVELADALKHTYNNSFWKLKINKVFKARTNRQQLELSTHITVLILDTLCFYHAKFGRKAKKCREPCSFGNDTTKGH